VADSIDFVATELEKATGGDAAKLPGAVQKLIQQIMEQHGRVVFNGDGYSEAWHQEAEKRGLANLKTTVDALPAIVAPEVVAVFEKYNVLSPREVQSRQDIYLEQYVKTVLVEAKLTVEIAKTMVLPTAIRYLGELAGSAANVKAAGLTPDLELVEKVAALTKSLKESIASLEGKLDHHGASGLLEEAKHFCHDICPAMLAVRKTVDDLEGIVADDIWPLPTYQEMLFIK
jgi:glutamine synthetase